jgi:hypothetical protein
MACASNAELKENMLSASGFKAKTPKTPTQIASFNSPPAHKLAKTTYKGQTVWVYRDPTVCGCLYIGDAHAHDVYLQKQAQKTTSDMNALNSADNATNIDMNIGTFDMNTP